MTTQLKKVGYQKMRLCNFLLDLLIQHNKFHQLKLDEINASIHYMEKGAGINWHNDASWKYGATYYLNNRWNPDWGGEFMFKSKIGSGFIPVVGNSIVIIKTGLQHKVNANLKKTHDRLSIQTWIS